MFSNVKSSIFRSSNLSESTKTVTELDESRTLEQIIESHGIKVQLHNITTEDGYYLALYRLMPRCLTLSSSSSENNDYTETIDCNNAKIEENSEPWTRREDIYYRYTVVRKPVLLQHGLFGSAADWVIGSPFLWSNNGAKWSNNLAFALHLTDRYDVWLGNVRGNGYSRGHISISWNDPKYWEFSTLDHSALYDTSAMLDYVINVTSVKKVGYVGYSQVRNKKNSAENFYKTYFYVYF